MTSIYILCKQAQVKEKIIFLIYKISSKFKIDITFVIFKLMVI